MTKTAILFNGAAAYISQEVAMLDMLMSDRKDIPGLGLNFKDDVEFVAGLSSGALLTLATNLSFSDKYPMTWESFKDKTLFPLKTKDVWKWEGEWKKLKCKRNTKPLNNLLKGLLQENECSLIEDLPFKSAIITSTHYSEDKENHFRQCWLTNIAEIAQQLPKPPKDENPFKMLRSCQSKVELVTALMGSTAIPKKFPEQQLCYEDNDSKAILDPDNNSAKFVDGGFASKSLIFGGRVFGEFESFFNAYLEQFDQFDRVYIISPDFNPDEQVDKQVNDLPVNTSDMLDEEEKFDFEKLMRSPTKAFIQKIAEYNKDQKLAKKIYSCQPKIKFGKKRDYLKFLKFEHQKDQYDNTIKWCQDHLDQIAIDINTLP